jgi:2',3'-cyclic-nucleotide 2'-phosphodiesterase/3'-nucleotidase
VPSYVFDVISGITYDIDLTAPARYGAHGKRHTDAHRIVNMRYNGIPISDSDEFVVVTNNYRADSGGIVSDPAAVILRAPDQTRDIIVRYILSEKTIDVATPLVWRFAPIGAPVTVTFESSPAAAAILATNPNIRNQGDAGDGFNSYALTLT